MRKYVLIIIILISQNTRAQKLTELQIGTNFFETQSFGNNPLTISYLMKNPLEFNNYINNFQHDGLGGSGRFYSLTKSINFSTAFSLKGNSKLSKKLLINLGISVGLEESHPTGFLSKRYMTNPIPSVNQLNIETLNFSERRNYLGVQLGLTYIFRPEKKASFFSGIQYLYHQSILHTYSSSIDKLTFTSTNGGAEVLGSLNYENRSWSGRSYSVQRLFIPLGLNIHVAEKYRLRPAVQFGLYWPPKPFRIADESHGFSIQIVRIL
ncbi:MAG: hypothetical protein CUR34_09500 [Sediminibacterium sp.]|nr:MAG: hypothetical protein CUR34_09500 [Sediminibacterium sp.] [Sediminibacterium sp. FEMGT703S]